MVSEEQEPGEEQFRKGNNVEGAVEDKLPWKKDKSNDTIKGPSLNTEQFEMDYGEWCYQRSRGITIDIDQQS